MQPCRQKTGKAKKTSQQSQNTYHMNLSRQKKPQNNMHNTHEVKQFHIYGEREYKKHIFKFLKTNLRNKKLNCTFSKQHPHLEDQNLDAFANSACQKYNLI